MCGIVGYIGKNPAYPVLINGLKKLEYRGYDSSGISIVDKKVKTYKCKGKIGDLEKYIKGKDFCRTGSPSCPEESDRCIWISYYLC